MLRFVVLLAAVGCTESYLRDPSLGLDDGEPSDTDSSVDTDAASDTDTDGDSDEPLRELVGDYEVRNSADIEALAGYQAITGNLLVSVSGLTTLAGMEQLVRVGGEVAVEDSPDLVSIEGLGGLRSVGGLRVIRLDALESLAALGDLGSAGSVRVEACPRLTDLRGFERLTRVEGRVELVNLAGLESVSGFEALEAAVGGLSFRGLPVRSLRGFGSLTSVGDFDLLGFDELASLEGFGTSTLAVSGSLAVGGNDKLTTLEHLPRIDAIGGKLDITHMEGLPNLSGLDSVVRIGGRLQLAYGVPASLRGLHNLESVGELLIKDTELRSLAELSALRSVAGNLTIERNYELEELGLTNLETIGGTARLSHNPLCPDQVLPFRERFPSCQCYGRESGCP